MAFHATLPYTEPGGSDNWKYHAEDIYRIGGYVSDGNLALILAREAREAFEYLDRLGVPFVKRSGGRADQFITDGSEYARACYTGPRTANHIEEALLRKASMDIGILNHCMIAESSPIEEVIELESMKGKTRSKKGLRSLPPKRSFWQRAEPERSLESMYSQSV
jgi:succinate dehydrogenase/fumarate reductase flavoprotein subunit